MSKDRWRFTASEIKRAVTAVTGTGLTVDNVEIGRNGTVRVSVAPGTAPLAPSGPNCGAFAKTASDGGP